MEETDKLKEWLEKQFKSEDPQGYFIIHNSIGKNYSICSDVDIIEKCVSDRDVFVLTEEAEEFLFDNLGILLTRFQTLSKTKLYKLINSYNLYSKLNLNFYSV